jgi:hypothetical protein
MESRVLKGDGKTKARATRGACSRRVSTPKSIEDMRQVLIV